MCAQHQLPSQVVPHLPRLLGGIAITEIVKAKRSNGNRYGYRETERGLLELAMANGNAEQAARVLAADQAGSSVTPQPLLRWRAKDEQRYQQIRAEIRPEIMQPACEDHLRVAQEATAVVSQMTRRVAR